MNSLADGICQQIEQLVESSIHALKDDVEHNEESAAADGNELLQLWSVNYGRLPPTFRDKLISDLRSCIVDLETAFHGFGDYSVLIVSMLQKCLSLDEIVQLIECSLQKPNLDNSSYVRLLSLILEVLDSKNNELKMKLTSLFLDSNPVVNFDRLADNRIYILLVQIYMKILPPTNILHLKQFYPILADKLSNEVLILKRYVDEEKLKNTHLIRASERILNLLLSAIYPLCTIRNSFLIMALSPNLIELCLRRLPTTESWFFQNFPILHKNILSVGFTFAKTHDFFVATSSLHRTNKFVGESPSSAFCQEQLNTLSALLSRSESLTNDTLEFLVDWLFLIVGLFGTGIQTVYECDELVSLRKAVLFLYFDENITTPTKLDNIADNLKVFEIMTDFGEEESRIFIEKFNSSSKLRKSADACHQIWKRIPSMFVSRLYLLTNCKTKPSEHNEIGFFERVSQIKTFLFQNNKNAFDQRFYRTNDQHFSKSQWDTLLKLFASDVTNSTPSLPSTQEVASLTIDELNKIRNEVQPAHSSYYNANNRQHFERKEREHSRLTCLLSLVEQLDKSVLERLYSTELQKLDHQKFRFCNELGLDTNALLNIFNCAYKAGHYELIVFFSTQFFLQFEDRMFNGELLVVICWMVRALVELKDAQPLLGLKSWLERTFGASLVWLDYAAMLADGRIENALAGLDSLSVEYLDNRDIVTETIFMLRERALRHLLDPSLCHQYAPAFYSQFMRPIGAPPMFSTEMLNPAVVLELSSWNQFDRLRTPVAPPNYEAAATYNLFNSFDQIDSNLSSMQKIFTNFGAQSVRDVLTCLHESEKQLLNLSRHFGDFGLSSSIGSRLFPLHLIIQQFRDIVFSTETVNSTQLNELLLHNDKLSDFERLEIAQKIANWVEKFTGTTHLRFTELSPSFVKLSRKTGNLRLASSYLNKTPKGILNQNILKNNFGELSNLSEALKLEILRNDPSNNVGLQQKFFALADLTASHTDVYLASNVDNSGQAPEPIVNACLKLGKLVKSVPVKRELFTNKPAKSIFWKQVLENLNTYQTNCPGESFERLLSGAFLSIPSFLSTQMPKAHRRLSAWALEQISTDTSFGVDAIRLLPSEEVALHALCGLTEKNRENFLKFVGQNDTLDELQEQIQNAQEFMTDATVINGIQSKSFEQLWNALKTRQQQFYGIATNSSIKFLENSDISKPADQVSASLSLINLLVSHPNLFSQQEAASDWIERTSVKAWIKIVQTVFAYINHRDSFVRETFKLLIEKIGISYPHAICYPAFVRANQISGIEQAEEDESAKHTDNQNTEASRICVEVVENLRSLRPRLVSDLQMFIEEFQNIVMLTSEKWLFVLNYLEQGIQRSCKQIEKESAQFLEVVQSQEVLNQFVQQATLTVFKNALTTIEDLYRSTCEGICETVERQRFVRNFKELIKRTIKAAKQKFEQPNPTFEVFRKLMTRLNVQISMQSQYRIKLGNLSPKLASCTNLSIPIPGQELTEFDDGLVTIQSVDPFISMLPTKTRPKKLKFMGANGRQYSFLCKGQEDLRVDENISNLFRICNYLFDASKYTRQNPRLPYSLQYYAVTPLSPRSGLIQWVQDPISIYAIYRSWRASKLNQYRSKRNFFNEKSLDENLLVKSPERKNSEPVFDLELLSGQEERVDQIFDFMAQQQLSQNSAAELELSPKQETLKQAPRLLRHVPDQTAQRLKMSPIELFISVLKSKFSEKNINPETMKNRKNWPSDVLLDVFNELSTLMPSTLIADEMWLKSTNSSEWWSKVKQFARSTAISSIVGALLGLGDRHLDNLLVDFSTGQVVHVDFNVAYNKGKNLRVPEVVPFRLTRNIVAALGPTKFEGSFRCSSENTMELLRSNSAVITSMLNTFTHDPLLEWISTSKQFNMGNLNIGISLVVYDQDRREQFAAKAALQFLHLYLDAFVPRFNELRKELETALLAICQLFTEMNNYRLNNGPELHHFNDQRVSIGTRLKNAIVAHQNMMRPLKPLFRILTRVDLRFSNFMKTYRSMFSNPLVNGHRLLANEKNIDYLSCIKNFQTSLINAESVYAQLAELRNISSLSDNIVEPMSAISCEDVSLAGSIFQEVLTASHNRKGTNEVAAEIVHKCQLFLKGLDSEKGSNVMTVDEHVDSLIMSATDKQNLSKMFEGWCSWI